MVLLGLGACGVLLVALILPQAAGLTLDPGSELSQATSGRAASPLVGRPAPDFIASSTEAAPVRLSDYRGRPVWLHFFSSWCARCRSENPEIQAVYEEERLRGSDLVLLSVGITDSPASAADFAAKTGLAHLIVADPDSAVAARYMVRGVPTHAFVDRAGSVQDFRIGALSPEAMRDITAALR